MMSILDVVGLEVLPVVGMKRDAIFSPRFGVLFVSADLGPDEVQAKVDQAIAAALTLIR